MRSPATRLLAAFVVLVFSAGCAAKHAPVPAGPPPPPPPPPVETTAPYKEGFAAGRVAANDANLAGYYAGGVVAGIAVVALCALMLAAAGGGGSGGGCNSGGCGGGGGGSKKQYLPENAHTHEEAYRIGYDAGYKERHEERKETALGIGFGIGVGIFAIGALWYLSDPDRRKKVDSGNDANANGATAASPLSISF